MSNLPEIPALVLPPTGLSQVSDEELAKFADLIYARTGIRISPQKKMLLSNRLRRRLRQTGISSFRDYYEHLRRIPSNDPEWDAFLQEITTHETYLFRDEAQWNWFREVFLPECVAKAQKTGKATLRIWSAACSTGDEPFTIAACIAADLPNLSQWRIRILGTDIGLGALEQAKAAVFGQRAMRLVPTDIRTRFFTKATEGDIWQAKPILRQMVTFRQHNLLEPLHEEPFDLVFVKNVLIYFDPVSKRTALNHIRAAVAPGGLLAAGAAEGVGDYLKDFVRLQPWLYKKPA